MRHERMSPDDSRPEALRAAGIRSHTTKSAVLAPVGHRVGGRPSERALPNSGCGAEDPEARARVYRLIQQHNACSGLSIDAGALGLKSVVSEPDGTYSVRTRARSP